MMTALARSEHLIDRLPAVRGGLRENVDLGKITWFQVGGPAEVMFQPEDEADLAAFLASRPKDIPIFPIGLGSNILVRDGGIDNVVLRLGRNFAKMLAVGEELVVGAGAVDVTVAKFAAEHGLTGAEFLSGIPGTIGGALRMNAGAYGREIRDILISAIAYDNEGNRHEIPAAEMGFSYRHCEIPADWIFTEARFKLQRGEKEEILSRMADIKNARLDSQPIKAKTGGSTFANPEGHKAWQLIDKVGARGLSIGDAMISDKHCNFLINKGHASAADLEAVGEEARRRVFAECDILLRWEIVRVGNASSVSTEKS